MHTRAMVIISFLIYPVNLGRGRRVCSVLIFDKAGLNDRTQMLRQVLSLKTVTLVSRMKEVVCQPGEAAHDVAAFD